MSEEQKRKIQSEKDKKKYRKKLNRKRNEIISDSIKFWELK